MDKQKKIEIWQQENCFVLTQSQYDLIIQTVRKETAEKFAKESKQRLKGKLHRGKALHATVFGKEYVRRIFKEVIDEICKEITEEWKERLTKFLRKL